jgi:hypothetical protein
VKRLLKTLLAPRESINAQEPSTTRHLRPRRSKLALESRVVFDGAVAATSADNHALIDLAVKSAQAVVPDAARPAEAAHAAPAAESTTASRETQASAATVLAAAGKSAAANTIVFIDGNVSNLRALQDAVVPGATVVVLDGSRDGVTQIAEALAGRSGLDSIQIISHGSQGTVQLGNVTLGADDLARYQDALQQWGAALKPGGDILLFGCDVAQGSGANFVDRLASLTGADIAASTDATGAGALGGDWALEKQTGAIEAVAALSVAGEESYDHLLANTAPSVYMGTLKQADGTDIRENIGNIRPFSTAQITDPDAGDLVSLVIDYTNTSSPAYGAGIGTLSGAGLTYVSPGVYSLAAASPATLQSPGAQPGVYTHRRPERQRCLDGRLFQIHGDRCGQCGDRDRRHLQLHDRLLRRRGAEHHRNRYRCDLCQGRDRFGRHVHRGQPGQHGPGLAEHQHGHHDGQRHRRRQPRVPGYQRHVGQADHGVQYQCGVSVNVSNTTAARPR